MASPMPTVTLPSGDQIPVLGQGTWHLAEIAARRNSEIAALRAGRHEPDRHRRDIRGR
jgi:diketogulonate reductase-like aldo/keto reductase